MGQCGSKEPKTQEAAKEDRYFVARGPSSAMTGVKEALPQPAEPLLASVAEAGTGTASGEKKSSTPADSNKASVNGLSSVVVGPPVQHSSEAQFSGVLPGGSAPTPKSGIVRSVVNRLSQAGRKSQTGSSMRGSRTNTRLSDHSDTGANKSFHGLALMDDNFSSVEILRTKYSSSAGCAFVVRYEGTVCILRMRLLEGLPTDYSNTSLMLSLQT